MSAATVPAGSRILRPQLESAAQKHHKIAEFARFRTASGLGRWAYDLPANQRYSNRACVPLLRGGPQVRILLGRSHEVFADHGAAGTLETITFSRHAIERNQHPDAPALSLTRRNAI